VLACALAKEAVLLGGNACLAGLYGGKSRRERAESNQGAGRRPNKRNGASDTTQETITS